MASIHYISIIRLFEFCGISAGADYIASRARKQLQAEFGISQEGFIKVDGFSYTRQQVFEEVDHPDFDKRLVFHKRIWERPELLMLLELFTVNVFTIGEDLEEFRGDDAFVDFFSPFFEEPFQYISRNLLTEHKLREMGEWLKYENFLLPAEREAALRPLRLFLEENNRLLRNVNSSNFDIMRPKIEHWFQTSWYVMFNNLPYECYENKMDIVTLLINLSVSIQKSNKYDCQLLSDQLIDLIDIEENLRSIIVSNHKVYSSKSGTFENWRGIWAIIWLGIMILRIANCNSSSSSTISNGSDIWKRMDTAEIRKLLYSNDTVTIKPAETEQKQITKLDSILNKIEKTN